MSRIYTLNDVGNSDGSKLGSLPSNRYPPNRLVLEEQLKKDREMFIRSARQLITKYHVLDKKNKCMQSALNASHEENERIQNDLNHLHEENGRMQNDMDRIIPLTMQVKGLNDKLVSRITCERKIYAELKGSLRDQAKLLKEIESLKSKNDLLESSVSQREQAKNSEITSLEARINELEAELEHTAQKALLAEGAKANDSDTTQSLESRVKELKNELEQITQDSSFKDGLIFCLRSRVSNLEDECDRLTEISQNSKIGSAEADDPKRIDPAEVPLAKPSLTDCALASSKEKTVLDNASDSLNPSDLAKDGEAEEDVPHFSSECEPNGKGNYDSISAVPALGGSNSSD